MAITNLESNKRLIKRFLNEGVCGSTVIKKYNTGRYIYIIKATTTNERKVVYEVVKTRLGGQVIAKTDAYASYHGLTYTNSDISLPLSIKKYIIDFHRDIYFSINKDLRT